MAVDSELVNATELDKLARFNLSNRLIDFFFLLKLVAFKALSMVDTHLHLIPAVSRVQHIHGEFLLSESFYLQG